MILHLADVPIISSLCRQYPVVSLASPMQEYYGRSYRSRSGTHMVHAAHAHLKSRHLLVVPEMSLTLDRV